MTSHRSNILLTVAAALGIAVLSGCTSQPVEKPSSSETSSAASVTSTPLLESQSSTILGQALSYPLATPAQVSSSIIELPPGVETGMHRHDAPMYAYILEGTLIVTYDGGITKTYRTGEAIMEAIGTAHNGKNDGTSVVKILVVNMGAEGVANSVKLP